MCIVEGLGNVVTPFALVFGRKPLDLLECNWGPCHTAGRQAEPLAVIGPSEGLVTTLPALEVAGA